MTVQPSPFSRQKIIANITTLFSGSALAQGLTAASLLLAARQIGSAQYGQYTASYTLVGFTAIVFSLGLDLWMLRNVGREPEHTRQMAGSVLAIKAVLGILWLVVMFGIAQVIDSSRFPADIVRLSAVIIWLDSLLATNMTIFRASLRNQYSSALEVGADSIWLLSTLTLIGLGQTNTTDYLWARLGAILIGCLASLGLVWVKIRPTISPEFFRRAFRETRSFAMSDLLAWAAMRQDVLIIALILGEEAAGVYSPAVGIINAAFLLPGAIYLVLTPVLSNLYRVNAQQAWKTAQRGIWASVAVGAVSTVGIAILAGPVAFLLGESFQGSREILLILSVLLFTHSIAYAMAAIVVATGQQSRRNVVQIIAVGLNILLNLLIVGWAGIRGAAVAYVIADVVLTVGYSLLAWRYRKGGR